MEFSGLKETTHPPLPTRLGDYLGRDSKMIIKTRVDVCRKVVLPRHDTTVPNMNI